MQEEGVLISAISPSAWRPPYRISSWCRILQPICCWASLGSIVQLLNSPTGFPYLFWGANYYFQNPYKASSRLSKGAPSPTNYCMGLCDCRMRVFSWSHLLSKLGWWESGRGPSLCGPPALDSLPRDALFASSLLSFWRLLKVGFHYSDALEVGDRFGHLMMLMYI